MDQEQISAETSIKTTATAEELAENCALERPTDPCTVVIFGATGDLTARKLFPALHTLYSQGSLPDSWRIVGASRSDLSHKEFRERMRKALAEFKGSSAGMAEMEDRIFYCKVDFKDPASFKELASFLEQKGTAPTKETEKDEPDNRLFYLAVPPTAYETIAQSLGKAGLAKEKRGGVGWVRLVVEKPFGHDLASARELDKNLHDHFAEHQIFRIDHYLAKETVQNVIMLRFANAIFEPIWNRQFIESVSIMAVESIGVGHRAGYYDKAGVLRDMFQNHMMQLLALSAMEPPSLFEGDLVRDEKTKVYRALRPFPTNQTDQHLVLGQYAAGVVDGERVEGYLSEEGVAPDSITPTFASMRVFVDNWRWQGVPFYLTSGKRLKEKRTEISVHFKKVPFSMFRNILGDHITANRLTLAIQPREEVRLTFQAKTPGSRPCLRSVTMNFNYYQDYDGPVLDAYEKVLIDCMLGDHTLFWRQDSVELCWGFLTPILMECDCPEKAERILLYRSGTWGPQGARKLLKWDEDVTG